MTRQIAKGETTAYPFPMRLDDYLERIRHERSVAADLQTLRSVVFAHATSIPFESLDPLAGVTVSLEPDAIFDKLVRRRRGGYCFEQNALLAWALRKIRFDVAELSARVAVVDMHVSSAEMWVSKTLESQLSPVFNARLSILTGRESG